MNIRTDHAEWTDRLSDYLAGDLGSSDHDRVEAHLAECGACRRVLEDLNRIVAEAAALGPIEPPRDLWGGIAATIQAPPAQQHDTKVIALPVGDAGRTVREHRKRLSFSMPQLAAAAIVLVAASSLATWVAGPGLAATTPAIGGAANAGSVTMASTAAAPPAEMADELASLETMLREARTALDPNTVRVLERNLAVIEKAIDDSRQALLQDPENTYLSQHLERVFQRKLAYLRDAARVAEWSS